MRTIKFKGKRIDNKEWVVGNYLLRHDSIGSLALIEVQDMEDFSISTYQVYPESVGQYTNITDINNKEVYVGDIVRYLMTGLDLVVKFGFCKKFAFVGFYLEAEDGYQMPVYEEKNFIVRVIGNAYDYPYKLTPPDKRHPAIMTDPKEAQEEVKEPAEQAGEPTESAEEGGTE